MRIWIVAPVVGFVAVLPLTAGAAECGRWIAGMEEEEEGRVMEAHICSGSGPAASHLMLTCGEAGKLFVRVLPPETGGFSPEGMNFTADLIFSSGAESVTRPARFEEMDGAMATDTDIDGPLIPLLESGASVTIGDAAGKVPKMGFTLAGSKAALETLLKTCSGR